MGHANFTNVHCFEVKYLVHWCWLAFILQKNIKLRSSNQIWNSIYTQKLARKHIITRITFKAFSQKSQDNFYSIFGNHVGRTDFISSWKMTFERKHHLQTKLFTNFFFFVFGSTLKICHTFRVTPISWDPIRCQTFIQTGKYNGLKRYGIFTIFLAQAIFQVHQIWKYRQPADQSLFFLLIAFLIQVVIIVGISLFALRPSLWSSSFNGAINYLSNYSGKAILVL